MPNKLHRNHSTEKINKPIEIEIESVKEREREIEDNFE
jgi:hypothetical protein